MPTPRRGRRGSRIGTARTALIAGALVLIVVLIFIIENAHAVTITFFGAHLRISLAVALLLAAIAGALIMAAAGRPASPSCGWRCAATDARPRPSKPDPPVILKSAAAALPELLRSLSTRVICSDDLPQGAGEPFRRLRVPYGDANPAGAQSGERLARRTANPLPCRRLRRSASGLSSSTNEADASRTTRSLSMPSSSPSRCARCCPSVAAHCATSLSARSVAVATHAASAWRGHRPQRLSGR